MTSVIIICLVALGVLFIYFLIKGILDNMYFKRKLKDSLIIFGKKGHGKSLLFSKIALYYSKKNGYASNVPFKHKNEKIISVAKDLSISPNNQEKFLNNDITVINKKDDLENVPILIDDAGIYLPNYLDSLLKKVYPSLPISYALWRHLYNAPIYINSQSVNRCYALIREQADGFIKARRVIKLGLFCVIKCTYYSNIDSASRDLAPMEKKLIASDKNRYYEYQALYGEIKDFSLYVWSFKHKYDSRHFHNVLFGYNAKDFDNDLIEFDNLENLIEKENNINSSSNVHS